MDDLRHRDLSSKPESELTVDERLELNRRFEEFVGLLRKKGGIAAKPKAKPKTLRRWQPPVRARRRG